MNVVIECSFSPLCSLIIFNSSNIWKDSAYDGDYPSDGARHDLGPESSDKSPMIEILSKYENLCNSNN